MSLSAKYLEKVRMMLKKSIATLTASMALLFVGVPVAAADDPNQTQYGNAATSLPSEPKTLGQGAVNTAPAVAQGAVPVQGTLPFTGLDIGIALAIGVAAVAGGLGLRRLGRVES